jgi:hypothetical protein
VALAVGMGDVFPPLRTGERNSARQVSPGIVARTW